MKKVVDGILVLVLLAMSSLMDKTAAISAESGEAKLDPITVAGSGTGTCIGSGTT